MKTARKFGKQWYVRLTLVLIPLVMGLIGFSGYYQETLGTVPPDTVLYSTARLFGLSFDGAENGTAWYDILLRIARWLAVIPVGHVLLTLLSPLTALFLSDVRFYFWNLRKSRLLIIGSDEECRQIYDNACKSSPREKPMIFCDNEENFRLLWKEGYRCVHISKESALKSAISRTFISDARKLQMVISEQTEEENLECCRIAVQIIENRLGNKAEQIRQLQKEADKNGKEIWEQKKAFVTQIEQLQIVVLGKVTLESVYADLVRHSYGILRYTSKARMIALDLIENYPLAGFLNRAKDLDAAGAVSPDLAINMIMIGFGETCQEILTTSMMVNQFVTVREDGIPATKPVHYHIFDSRDARTNKNLNHMAFRFAYEFKSEMASGMIRESDYLPLPDDPAEIAFDPTDIHDRAFYERIWKITAGYSVNVIVIAADTDLENIDLAYKLRAKAREWGVRNCSIFVRIRKNENRQGCAGIDAKEIMAFGDVSSVLDPGFIFRDELDEMARKKHYMNALIKRNTEKGFSGTKKDIETESAYEWHTYDPMKKKSSISSILAIRSKLIMMGLDYRKKGTHSKGLPDNNAYYDIYAGDDRPRVSRVLDSIGGLELYDYRELLNEEDFRVSSLRRNLAVQEHLRWNAFMICNGFVPASLQQIKSGTVKDYELRFHANLTTFHGLFEYRRKMAEWHNRPESAYDVINYDFHLMDEAWWYLNMFGYEVFPVKEENRS